MDFKLCADKVALLWDQKSWIKAPQSHWEQNISRLPSDCCLSRNTVTVGASVCALCVVLREGENSWEKHIADCEAQGALKQSVAAQWQQGGDWVHREKSQLSFPYYNAFQQAYSAHIITLCWPNGVVNVTSFRPIMLLREAPNVTMCATERCIMPPIFIKNQWRLQDYIRHATLPFHIPGPI